MNIPKDKVGHFLAGVIIAGSIGMATEPLIGLWTGIAVGALKETVWDKLLDKGTPEMLDFVATAVGALVGYGLLWIL